MDGIGKLSDEDIQDMILAVLAKHPEGLTEREIQHEIIKEYGIFIPLEDEVVR